MDDFSNLTFFGIFQIWSFSILAICIFSILLFYLFFFIPDVISKFISNAQRKRRNREKGNINVPWLRKRTSWQIVRDSIWWIFFFSITRIATCLHGLRGGCVRPASRRINFPGDTSCSEHTPLSCPFLYERGRGERENRYPRAPRVGAISPRCLRPIDYRRDSRNDEGGSGAFGETASRR